VRYGLDLPYNHSSYDVALPHGIGISVVPLLGGEGDAEAVCHLISEKEIGLELSGIL
jgi:hypothetical protein